MLWTKVRLVVRWIWAKSGEFSSIKTRYSTKLLTATI